MCDDNGSVAEALAVDELLSSATAMPTMTAGSRD